MFWIYAVIPQGSIEWACSLYTSDMPFMKDFTVATYADDTALIANNDCPTEASNVIQNYLGPVSDCEFKLKIKLICS